MKSLDSGLQEAATENPICIAHSPTHGESQTSEISLSHQVESFVSCCGWYEEWWTNAGSNFKMVLLVYQHLRNIDIFDGLGAWEIALLVESAAQAHELEFGFPASKKKLATV